MADSINTQVALQNFTVNGVDIRRHVNNMNVFENICKPYRTATATIIDNADIINSLKLVGGENVGFTMQADGGGNYTANLQIFSIKGQRSATNLRSMLYQIELIGPQFFGDRQNMVQQSFKNITGTDIIQRIHSKFIGGNINIQIPSIGLLGKGNSIIASSTRPFKFIDDIRRQLMFGKYKTGSSVYFHDNQGVNLAPLEHLFSTMSPQNVFIQKATWGARWQDIFEAQNAIMAAATTIDENHHGGQMNMMDISAAINQEKKVVDIFSHKRIFNDLVSKVPPGVVAGVPIANLIKLTNPAGGASHGGRHNYYYIDTQKVPKENVRQTDKESLYQAMITSGPQIIIKVPVQGGFSCTVGKGFTAKILPVMGDQDTKGYDPQNSGDYLCTQLMIEAHFDDTTPGGTVTLLGKKGGIQQ